TRSAGLSRAPGCAGAAAPAAAMPLLVRERRARARAHRRRAAGPLAAGVARCRGLFLRAPAVHGGGAERPARAGRDPGADALRVLWSEPGLAVSRKNVNTF